MSVELVVRFLFAVLILFPHTSRYLPYSTRMLVLSSLHNLLSQVLSLPSLHTAVLFTPEGQLVSYASARSKDEIRVVVGISGEIWQETKQQGIGMVDSELGRILVLPVLPLKETASGKEPESSEGEPVMLVALNAQDIVEWDELRMKAKELVYHLEKPVNQLRGRLTARVSQPSSSTRNSAPRLSKTR